MFKVTNIVSIFLQEWDKIATLSHWLKSRVSMSRIYDIEKIKSHYWHDHNNKGNKISEIWKIERKFLTWKNFKIDKI